MNTTKHDMTNKDGIFAIKYRKDGKKTNPQVEAQFRDIFLNAPADAEALAEWHKSKTFKLGSVTFTGLAAAAAAKVLHDVETVRGKARQMLEGGATPSAVEAWLRKEMLNHVPGKKLVEVVRPKVDPAMLVAMQAQGPEALAEYLRSVGIDVPDEETDEEEQDDEQEQVA